MRAPFITSLHLPLSCSKNDKKDISEAYKNPLKLTSLAAPLSPFPASNNARQTPQSYPGVSFPPFRLSETSNSKLMQLGVLGGLSVHHSLCSAPFRPSVSTQMAAFGALSPCPYSLLWRPKPTNRCVSCSVGSSAVTGSKVQRTSYFTHLKSESFLFGARKVEENENGKYNEILLVCFT